MVDGRIIPEDEQNRQVQAFITSNEQYAGFVVIIEDDTADTMWAELFAEINKERKERESWFEDIKGPLVKALAALNVKEHQACDRLKDIEYQITQARGAWMQTKNKKIKETNAAALTEAEKSGGVAVLQQKTSSTVHVGGGASVGLRTQPSWRLTDDKMMTAKHIETEKVKLDRSDPRLKNVPDHLFILQPGLIMSAIKHGLMPEGEHSIEKYDSFASTSK
jgi:hypothetical protein